MCRDGVGNRNLRQLAVGAGHLRDYRKQLSAHRCNALTSCQFEQPDDGVFLITEVTFADSRDEVGRVDSER
jgi:hypothetical protein